MDGSYAVAVRYISNSTVLIPICIQILTTKSKGSNTAHACRPDEQPNGHNTSRPVMTKFPEVPG